MIEYEMSYSCQIEHLRSIYMNIFGLRNHGSFVDVGSHDGYQWSNVWGLAKAGWKGLLIEPVPELAEKCKNLYKDFENISVLRSAIGSHTGTTSLYFGSNPTINLETVEKNPWGDKYDTNNFIIVNVDTLDSVLEKYTIPIKFDLLCIDVEGAELEVLEGFSICKWIPRLVIVETHDGNPDIRRSFHAEKINKYFKETHSYELIFKDGLNSIFENTLGALDGIYDK